MSDPIRSATIAFACRCGQGFANLTGLLDHVPGCDRQSVDAKNLAAGINKRTHIEPVRVLSLAEWRRTATPAERAV